MKIKAAVLEEFGQPLQVQDNDPFGLPKGYKEETKHPVAATHIDDHLAVPPERVAQVVKVLFEHVEGAKIVLSSSRPKPDRIVYSIRRA